MSLLRLHCTSWSPCPYWGCTVHLDHPVLTEVALYILITMSLLTPLPNDQKKSQHMILIIKLNMVYMYAASALSLTASTKSCRSLIHYAFIASLSMPRCACANVCLTRKRAARDMDCASFCSSHLYLHMLFYSAPAPSVGWKWPVDACVFSRKHCFFPAFICILSRSFWVM